MARLSQRVLISTALLFACALSAGCSRKSEDAKIQVYIPKLTSQERLSYRPNYSGKTVSAQSSNFNSLLNPTTLADFNCFIVFVGGAGFESGGSCSVSDGTSFKLGAFGGGVTAGTLLEMTVPSGSREIVLVGFKTEDTASCSDFHNGMPSSSLSEPFVLARESKNVSGASLDVNLSPSSMTAKVTNCNFAQDSGGGGAYFGSGADGNIVGAGDTQMAFLNPSGQRFSSRSAVDAITNMNDGTAQVIVQSAWNSSDEADVRVGNEMMLYVLGGNEGMPGGCGDLYPGFSISGMVTFVETGLDGNRFRMSVGDSRWFSIPATNLTASAVGAGGHTFCRVMAVRVPHFDLIIVPSGTQTLKVSSGPSTDFSQTNHSMLGLLPIRVKGGITVDSGASLIVQTNNGGHYGGNSTELRGQGYLGKVTTGWAATLEPNGSGGGYNASACGGGHGGKGGCGGADKGGFSVGDEYGCDSLDVTKSCLRGKFFFGGGGAADGGNGGAGGGAIRFYAKSIYNNGTITFSSNGGSGMGLDDGGGAGGSVYAAIDSMTGTGSLAVDVNGGNGNSNGGVGGGGRTHITVKSNTFTGTGAFSYFHPTGTGVDDYAEHGTCKVEGLPAAFCLIPPP